MAGEVAVESGTLPGDAETTPEVVAVPEAAVAEHLEVPPVAEKPKRPRPARAKKKPVADVVVEIPAPAAQVVVDETPPPPKPRRRAATKKTTEVDSALPEAVEEKPKPAPRARRKKKDEDSQ